MSFSIDDVLVERRGAVAVLTLNRPERRNGVDVDVCRAVLDRLREIAASDARVVVMRGAGRDFCVGADLRADAPEGGPPSFADLEPLYQSAVLLHSMPQVTLAAIDGGCAGAGLGWAGACDLRFASEGARFSTAFLGVGVSGDMGLPWTLTRIVGAARAREMMLVPGKFGADRALEIGLVNRVFDGEGLHEGVLAIAEGMASREPFALRMMKANLVSAEKLDFAAFIDIESARHAHTTGHLREFALPLAQVAADRPER